MHECAKHYQQLPKSAVVRFTDLRYDDLDHVLYACGSKRENKLVGAQMVFRREPAGSVPVPDDGGKYIAIADEVL